MITQMIFLIYNPFTSIFFNDTTNYNDKINHMLSAVIVSSFYINATK